MSPELRNRVTVATSGHLATCPRMLKAARALAEAGYRVRVVSTRFLPWADAADEEIARGGAALWDDWNRVPLGFADRAVHRAARTAAGLAGADGAGRIPLPLAARAAGPFHACLARAIAADPGALIYAGTSGALAAAAEAARRTGVPYALDLEDLHGAEHAAAGDDRAAHRTAGLLRRIQRSVLPGAAFLTTSSEPIAEAYRREYGVEAVVVHNVFPLPEESPEPPAAPPREAGRPLRLYWFSQTIGPERGLEEVILAAGRAGIPAELHLRGRMEEAYREQLLRHARTQAPRLSLHLLEPASPDRMVELCRPFDVGLAVEPGHAGNNALALSNKALTYILAGLPVVLTDTAGQGSLGRDLGAGALLYAPGDAATLAAGLEGWYRNPARLADARRAAWEAARRRWHWEHPAERGALLERVADALHGSEAAAS